MRHTLLSEDVASDGTSFEDLLLPDALCATLRAAGLVYPSPIQRAALPPARAGCDVIVQAKAGTGKTIIYAVAILESIDLSCPLPQVRNGLGSMTARKLASLPGWSWKAPPASRDVGEAP